MIGSKLNNPSHQASASTSTTQLPLQQLRPHSTVMALPKYLYYKDCSQHTAVATLYWTIGRRAQNRAIFPLLKEKAVLVHAWVPLQTTSGFDPSNCCILSGNRDWIQSHRVPGPYLLKLWKTCFTLTPAEANPAPINAHQVHLSFVSHYTGLDYI